jgi:hypothetical protein
MEEIKATGWSCGVRLDSGFERRLRRAWDWIVGHA